MGFHGGEEPISFAVLVGAIAMAVRWLWDVSIVDYGLPRGIHSFFLRSVVGAVSSSPLKLPRPPGAHRKRERRSRNFQRTCLWMIRHLIRFGCVQRFAARLSTATQAKKAVKDLAQACGKH